jgi:CheY-like chemotaxis protein/HPt (histidine-containing phosphotransfer) domain-containing protein
MCKNDAETKRNDERHLGEAQEDPHGSLEKQADSEATASRPVWVLLAEDYEASHQVFRRFLEKAGCHVDLAEDGEQAVRAFATKRYDLVLMDIEMPEMNGFEAAKCIRQLETSSEKLECSEKMPGCERVPIIAMTGHQLDESRDDFREAGMDDWLCKPLLKKDVIRMLHKWVPSLSGVTSRHPSIDDKYPPKWKIAEDKAPMDVERAVEEFTGDMVFFLQIFRGFLERLKPQLLLMHRALLDGDARLVEKLAHAIKGGAANLTAYCLAAAASDIEAVAEAGSLESGIELLARLEQEVARLDAFLESIS